MANGSELNSAGWPGGKSVVALWLRGGAGCSGGVAASRACPAIAIQIAATNFYGIWTAGGCEERKGLYQPPPVGVLGKCLPDSSATLRPPSPSTRSATFRQSAT